ncbi:MAG: protein-glutamate O-methyltransferase CheR [Chloroflexi bacterium]|nr:protein-glutamate O-methyltransferase CheR [Chloroflexota bacterium]MBP8056702.1 protein-glutamate O-methyltransferase CheR [Chloroflexota bacterium]
MNEVDLEKIEVALFLQALYQRHGYDFRHYAQASVRRRVRRLVMKKGFTHISQLIPHLLHDEQFAREIVHEFSITVTEMFRDPPFYQTIRERIISYLQTFPFIKVWHAGCATGEEAYSLAILLQEEGLYDRATIFATDFNDEALQKAQEGIYPLKEMRQHTTNYQRAGGRKSFADYYHAQYDLARLDQNLKRNITFANHNLVTDGVFSEVHLVLCRNVLIYFDRTLQNQVLQLLTNSLPLGGFLCLGLKESLHFSTVHEHFRVVDEKTRIYQKQTV